MLDAETILALGKTPLPGPLPCGVDASDDENYLLVQGEVGKMDRIDAGEPDWYRLEQAATTLLQTRSKDIEIAAFLGFALFKRAGYEGLAVTLGLLTEMVNAFWDGLFPERPRRRKSRIEMLCDRFTEGGWFRDHPPKPTDFDSIDRCLTQITALEEALKARMPDDPPDFGRFIRGLKDLAGRRPRAAEPASPAQPAAAVPGPAAAGSGEAAGSMPVAEVQDVGAAINQILAMATFIRKADPMHPVPYAVVRIIKWARIALPTTAAAKFEIDPPEPAKVEALTHQMANGLWENLLKNAEAAFRSSDPLWLDLQRYVCAAMAGLGSGYDKARQTVAGLTVGLVQRLGEGVYELRFRNGQPLCSGETRLWLEAEASALGLVRGGGGPAGTDDGRLEEARGQARQHAGAGNLKEALEVLQNGLAGCRQHRDRFLWKLAMAQLCFEAQRMQMALPLLEECQTEIERYHIDEWEPALAAQVASTLYRCRKALIAGLKEPSSADLQHVQEAFARLCRLDPLGALSAEPAGN